MYNDLDKKYSFRSKGIDEQLFRKLMNTDSTYYHFRDKDFIDKDKMILYYHNRVGFAVASIENFMDKVNDCLESEKKLMSAAHHYDMSAEVHCLLNIKTLDDFLRWKKAHGNSVRSKRVNEQPSSTLEACL